MVTACGSTEPHDWALVEEDGTELTLVVAVGSSSCSSLEGVRAIESDTEVRVIAAVKTETPGFGGGCTDDMSTERVSIVLDAPIGERELIGCDLGSGMFFGSRQTCRDIIEWP